jgi:predicted membrane channel-forming protein YqfA (hemolysin III family)
LQDPATLDPVPAPRKKPTLRGVSHEIAFYVSLLAGFLLTAWARPGKPSLAAMVYPGLFTTPSAASSPCSRLASFVLAARCGAPLVRLAALLRARPRFASETELSRRSLVNNPGYTGCVSALFGVSSLYHRPNWLPETRARLRRLDHAALYLLIAGAYTPVAILAVPGDAGVRLLALACA